MTNREFYEMVILFVNDSDLIINKSELGERLIEKAKAEIVKLDERNAKRASKPSKKAIENVPIRAHIAEFLDNNEGSHVASEIASALNLSTQKVSALCRQMVGDGVLTVEDVKVKGKGTQKSYSLA